MAVTRQSAALSASDWSQAAVGQELPPLAEAFEVQGNVSQPSSQRECVSDIFSAPLMISPKSCVNSGFTFTASFQKLFEKSLGIFRLKTEASAFLVFRKRFTLPNQWNTSAERPAVLLLSVLLSCFSLVHIMSFFPSHTVFLAQLPLAAQRFHMCCMRLIIWSAAVVLGLSKPTPSLIAGGSGTCTRQFSTTLGGKCQTVDDGCYVVEKSFSVYIELELSQTTSAFDFQLLDVLTGTESHPDLILAVNYHKFLNFSIRYL